MQPRSSDLQFVHFKYFIERNNFFMTMFENENPVMPLADDGDTGGNVSKQYLIPPFQQTGITTDFDTDCDMIAAAKEAGYRVCTGYRYTIHFGIDMIGGSNIRSSGYGEVVSVRLDNSESTYLGNTVLIKYPNAAYGSGTSKRNIYFLYCHLASVNVSVGDYVRPGFIIGVSGATGIGATATHLHLEAFTSKISKSPTEGGSATAVDPIPYLFNKTSTSDDYGYGKGTMVPDCDAPFYGDAYCAGTSSCSHGTKKLYFYDMDKIRNRGNWVAPTF